MASNILSTRTYSLQLPQMDRGILTPESIISKIFSLYVKTHFFHWQSDTIGKHLMLNELYPKLVELNDSIAEHLLGLQIPIRFGTVTVEQPGQFSDEAMMNMINDGCSFAEDLCDYAEQKDLEELCNLASELSQAFVKARLFSTYK